jgi:hypothetical protein
VDADRSRGQRPRDQPLLPAPGVWREQRSTAQQDGAMQLGGLRGCEVADAAALDAVVVSQLDSDQVRMFSKSSASGWPGRMLSFTAME